MGGVTGAERALLATLRRAVLWLSIRDVINAYHKEIILLGETPSWPCAVQSLAITASSSLSRSLVVRGTTGSGALRPSPPQRV